MKKLYFVILLLCSQQLFSQYLSSGIGRWKLGINVGGLCQKADVKHDVYNFGFGATLEYAAYQKQSSFFGFSFRGRFLNGKTTGYNNIAHNGEISNDAINGNNDTTFNYTNLPLYLNNRTKLNEFSLEGMLKWNKLYQNKGILFYLYFGAGFTNYKVETDQKDFTDFPYDYSFLLSDNPSVDEIKSLQDGEFETELINSDYQTMVFTPSFGVGFGFRLAPGLDFALEHKVSLPQTDLFDGQAIDNGDPSFIQDMYHYTSLGLIFSIVKYVEPTTYTPPVEPVDPTPVTPITPTPVRPTINLTQPTATSFNSPNCKVEVIAKIENVRHQGDITFYQNGTKVPSYKYFYSKPTFKCKVDLKEGSNSFKIVAKNASFTETKTFSLSCNNESTINICHNNNDGTSSNITIKESEWANHSAHGDSKGNCPEKQITICHNIPGQGGKTQTISISESQWSVHKSHGDYLGECSTKKMITICHSNTEITIDEKDWPTHAAHGDTKGDCPTRQVNMITICHVPPTGDKRVTTQIPENEWLVHQAHGDSKGACPAIEPTTTICHKNSNGTKSTITIPEFRWNEHFSHGDIKGACPEASFIICHKDPATGKKQNISITESLWPQHAAHGDTKGNCPVIEKQITICHNIPGKPGQTQTITIPESKWLLHKSHGDTKGACPKPISYIDICHKQGNTKINMKIKSSDWPAHASHGDTKGNCPEPVKYIEICHKYKNSKTNMTIKESEWGLHAAHGDTKGRCPEPITYIDICHKQGNTKVNMKIKSSDWPAHAAHGDVKGNCPLPEKNITICHYPPGNKSNPQTIEIPESAWPAHAAHGDYKGSCKKEDKKIEICHKDPKTGKKQTITIKESQWALHAAHGDIKGKCTGGTTTGPTITICHIDPRNPDKPITMQIPASAWDFHQAHGDKLGACSDNDNSGGNTGNSNSKKITICHANKEITIYEKDWPKHAAHGDNKGKCIDKDSDQINTVPTTITICHKDPSTGKKQTLKIPLKDWSKHQAHGDVKGVCPSNSKGKVKSKKVIKP